MSQKCLHQSKKITESILAMRAFFPYNFRFLKIVIYSLEHLALYFIKKRLNYQDLEIKGFFCQLFPRIHDQEPPLEYLHLNQNSCFFRKVDRSKKIDGL